ncbi:MAG: YkgJ family cysteine cluster protein [Spirochaetes bacterium]|nr:YkgJ family cysteine cluster protein [Spirochaetota bacterium]
MKQSPPCENCNAHCCRHLAVEIDKPTTKKEYDYIRWYLLHKDVSVFIDHHNDWFIKFNTDCEKIAEDNRCGYYEERPKICRDYPSADELCEFEGDEEYYTELFDTEEQFIDYIEDKKRNWRYKKLQD